MDRSQYRADWLASLPIAGRDGTLTNRMRDPPLLERVIAKTGTLSGVRTLSGYLTTTRGERVVFSILATNHLQSGAAADRVVEEALRQVAEAR
jgi:D-alanyl-D-alanine carboxypeptidase/D-alanyl-D-alanine-endopeptidase (penicillin-binding protein 4)